MDIKSFDIVQNASKDKDPKNISKGKNKEAPSDEQYVWIGGLHIPTYEKLRLLQQDLDPDHEDIMLPIQSRDGSAVEMIINQNGIFINYAIDEIVSKRKSSEITFRASVSQYNGLRVMQISTRTALEGQREIKIFMLESYFDILRPFSLLMQ